MENASVIFELNGVAPLNNTTVSNEAETGETCCDDSTQHYITFGRSTWIYGSPLLVILGTVGNVLSAMLMQSKRLRQYTTSVYLTLLAFVDTTVLFTGLSRQWILAVFDTDIRFLASGLCKVHLFLMYFLIQLEAWILVCVSSERMTAVWLPLKAQHLFTRRFALIQMSVLVLTLFVMNSHMFWTQILVPVEGGNICRFDPRFEIFRLQIWGWIDMVFSSILPFTIMIASSIAIGVKLYLQRHRTKTGSSGATTKTASVTVMLLVVCIVFFICTLPITIYLSKSDEYENAFGCCYSRYVTWPVVNMIMYLNNSVNFLLYCVSGPRFRRELRKMFGCKLRAVAPEDQTNRESAT